MIEALSSQAGTNAVHDVAVIPSRVTPIAKVRREREDDEPAIAPRRDTASFSREALAKLAAETCGDEDCD
jgi:hypothetical protein